MTFSFHRRWLAIGASGSCAVALLGLVHVFAFHPQPSRLADEVGTVFRILRDEVRTGSLGLDHRRLPPYITIVLHKYLVMAP